MRAVRRLFGCAVYRCALESDRMTLTLANAEDLQRLEELVSREVSAKQRDRYRAVLLVASEQLEGDEIAKRLGRSPRFVDEWVGRYRRGGIDAMRRFPRGRRAAAGTAARRATP